MKNFFYLLLTISLLFVLNCTIAKISGRAALPLYLNNPSGNVQNISHFDESKRILFDYTSAFDVSEVLANQLKSQNANAIANLTITLKVDVGDYFINFFTLGIANSKTFVVSGDLIRISKGELSLNNKLKIIASGKTIKDIEDQLTGIESNIFQNHILLKENQGFTLATVNIN